MLEIQNSPLFNEQYDSLAEFSPRSKSAYIFAESGETRSEIDREWMERHNTRTKFIQILEQRFEAAEFVTQFGSETVVTSLRSADQLTRFLDRLENTTVYVDLTGLDHAVWAALIRALLVRRFRTRVVYREPLAYEYRTTPTDTDIFDLSERINGLRPLPGFASLSAPSDDFVLVVCLGFEGARFAYLVEQLEPDNSNIIPVVGLPGFQPEYPFYAYWCNKNTLLPTRSWRRVRFAKANCPFSLFYLLSDISQSFPKRQLRIAPIGTKPHALGVVLFLLATSSTLDVEIVYDNPIRKPKRTAGASRVHVYHVSSFLPRTVANRQR